MRHGGEPPRPVEGVPPGVLSMVFLHDFAAVSVGNFKEERGPEDRNQKKMRKVCSMSSR